MDNDRLLSLNIVAGRLGVHVATVRAWCRETKIEFVVLPNGYYRVRKSVLEKIMSKSGKNHIEDMLADK